MLFETRGVTSIEPETVDHLFAECVYTRYVMWMASKGLSYEELEHDVRWVWKKWATRGGLRHTQRNLSALAAL